MVKLKINGRSFKVKEGMTILEIAKENDIPIPTLCYYEEVSPAGSCRLCIVEITSQKNRPLVTACTCPAEEGLEIRTHSKRVVASRRVALELLLARAPHSDKILELAEEMGVKAPSLPVKENACILCGLCVRACREMVGRSAITFMARGPGREKEEPSIQPSPERCIACGTCVYLCPTRFIKMEDYEDLRIIWDKVYKAKDHLISGRFYAPIELVDYVHKQEGLDLHCFCDETPLYLQRDEAAKKKGHKK